MRSFKTRPHLTLALLTLTLAVLFAASDYLSRVEATPLAPFIDLQERGLTVVQDGEGLLNWDRVTPASLMVNIGGPVRFALLYWNGRERPCVETAPGDCGGFAQPFKDQQMVFNGTPLTGTVIGTETQPVSAGGPILNVGYFADVTSIVAAAGPGNKTFTFADGNAASNLWRLNGVTLFVAYTNAADPNIYRVLVWDGLDFAFGPDPTPGDTRVTAPVSFNHGANTNARSAELYLVVGGGTADRPDNVTISNNPTLFNTLNGTAGPEWDSEASTINIPAGVGTTTVQVNSAPANQNPDALLWQVAALRVQQLDATPPSCSISTVIGPPFQTIHTIRDTGTGLAEILVTKSENADTVVPPFTVGTTDPVVVTSTKIDQSRPMCVEIRTTDLSGNVGFCNYCETLTFTKAFGAPAIPLNGTTTLAFNLSNPTEATATGVSFTDTLPSGLVVAAPNGLMGACGGGTITAAPGSGTISLTGATLAVNSSCTFSVNVQGTTPGVKPNSVSVTSTNGGTGNTATANVTVVAPPTLGKTFNPTTINPGASSQLTLTFSNPVGNVALTNLAVTDNLPAGVTIAATPGLLNTCTGGTVMGATAGSTSFSLSGGMLAAGASCQVQVNVTSSTPGTVTNTTTATTATGGGITVTGTAASAMLTVNPIQAPTVIKAFSPTAIATGGTSTLTITLGNANSSLSLTGASLTDTLPAGVTTVAATAATTCGGTASQMGGSVSLSGGTIPAGGSCTLSVQVTGTTGGAFTNTIAAGDLTTGNGGANAAGASATLTIVAPPGLAKSFSPTMINVGATSQLTLTFSNPAGNVALSNLAVSDSFPAGLTVAATPGLINTCGGVVAGATAGSTMLSLSGGSLPAGASSCQVQINVTSSTLGAAVNTTSNVTATGSSVNVTGTSASATLTVNAVTSTPIVTIVDPFGCTGPGDVLTVTVAITNPAVIAQPVTFTSTLPAGLVGLPGTGTSTVGAVPIVTAAGATFGPTELAAGQTATVTYQVQVGEVASGAQLCINTTSTFSGAAGPPVQACATVNCPTVGPGLAFPATSEVSDQKAGSVLVYNLYSSSAASPNTQNTRLSITNTNPALEIAVHLFFVDGATCSIADAIICLTKNQTASFLASDLDPGTTGYLIAVASDPTTGCPVNFNFLIGDAYVKLASGHQANLGAEAFSALAGGPVACDANSLTATLNFDGVSYNRAPRVLAASSIPARNDGNDTLLVINRFGGNLAIGAATLSNLFGIFYDDAENALSFTFSPGTCQFRSSLSNNFPRTTPRLETFIPAGRSGWLRLYSTSDIGLLGAVLNYNPNATTNAGAFNQGRNLHKLTLTATQTLVIPIFPPNCLN